MSEIQIEKGVAVPRKRPGRPNPFPFERMEVGDSFEVEREIKVVRSAASNFARRNAGYKFTTRQTGPDSCRVWRIA